MVYCMGKASSLLDSILRTVIIATFAVLPLFFLPFTRDFFDTNKWMLLAGSALAVLVLSGIRSAVSRQVAVSLSLASAGLILYAIALAVSLAFGSTNRVEAATANTGIVTVTALAVIIFLGGAAVNHRTQTLLKWALFVTATIISVIAVYMFFGIGKLMFPQVSFLADPLWTPVGNNFGSVSVMLLILPLLIDEAVTSYRKRADVQLTITSVMSLVTVFGVVLTLFQLIPKIPSSLMPFSSAWAILLEMYKIPKNMLVGVGAENFLNAFSSGRPASYNLSPVWNIRFTVSTSYLLHVATTLGLVGLAAFIVFLKNLIGGWKTGHLGLRISLWIAMFIFLFTPPSITVLVMVTAVLLLKPHHTEATRTFSLPEKFNKAALAFPVVALIILIPSVWGLSRMYSAERLFYQSLLAAQANNGTETYNLQNKALQVSPFITQYHITFSQTNLALANSIANSVNDTDKKELTEDDRKLIARLVQQAINEGKIAVNLSPSNVLAWETLATTYQNITGVVTGSEEWAIVAYQQAVNFDPVNPLLRLNLAGAYIIKQDYPSALSQLQVAASLKPDIANIRYNLAFVYRQMKDSFREASELKNTLALLPQGSADAERVAKEFDEVKKTLTPDQLTQLNEQVPEGSDTQSPLTTPQTEPEAKITPKIDLGEDASPPANPVSPNPEPTRQPEPTLAPQEPTAASPTQQPAP